MTLIASWRLNLMPASYNGIPFKVDVGQRKGGRRIAVHEFPKKDLPYPEDMGRKYRSFTISAYVIGPDYTFTRDDLVAALEQEGAGTLMLPTEMQIDVTSVIVNGEYTLIERREEGGIAKFEIPFIEAGQDTFGTSVPDTQTQSNSAAQGLITQSQAAAQAALIAQGGTP